jgi:valyl-tRNA synthetase
MEMPSRYQPGQSEEQWYERWVAAGYFHVEAKDAHDPFTIMIPPPNVTGALHMGHALNNTLQDIVARYQRLRGKQVLWLPGTDHAGIATQAVVEKKLLKEQGVLRQALGREAFVAEVWKWKEEYGNRILQQLRRLGCSCDWERTRFTLDEGLSLAVRESFVRLWEKGLIYRGERLINWDCKLQTAVSDDEIEQSEVQGKLYYLRYEVASEPGRFLVVATTRPETLFGDTGVAVHPDDERYRDLLGKNVVLPVIGRQIPVLADASVDPAFGTGAVKVTPAHDPNDYERGVRHGLPFINVLHKDGRLNEHAGPFSGVERLDARPKLVAMLEELGLLEKVQDHLHNVPHSDRSKTPIEPMISEQWFVKMKELAAPAIAAVKANDQGVRTVELVPARWESVYLAWLENVRDWCISRQLWWGHRIPVWYDEDGASVALRHDPEPGALHPTTGKPLVRQDEDVLDTWASSWLWPFSTLGWPAQTDELRAFYPTQFLSTDRGILYLWVARMVMASYEFLGVQPFTTVYLHATVLDERGRRMSKSLGNGIDPLEMIDQWGVDAVRFTLPLLTSEGQDIKLAPTKFEMGRNFCNKLWNASRFVLGNLSDFVAQVDALDSDARARLAAGVVDGLEDAFILGKLQAARLEISSALDSYRFNEAAQALYRFTWDELCDWYLEVVKPRLYDGKGGASSRLVAQANLVRCLDEVLTMLHPFAPFITEEIFANLAPHRAALFGAAPESLCIAQWPQSMPEHAFVEETRRFDFVRDVTRAARTIRAEHNLDRKTQLRATLHTPDEATAALLGESERHTVMHLAGLGAFEVGVSVGKPAASATAVLPGGSELCVDLQGLIDFSAEIERLQARVRKAATGRDRLLAKLENPAYADRAPADIVEKDRERVRELDAEIATIEKHIDELRAVVAP